MKSTKCRYILTIHGSYGLWGVGHVFVGFEVLENRKKCHDIVPDPFFWEPKARISHGIGLDSFFVFVSLPPEISSDGSIFMSKPMAILMLRMPSMSLPSLPSFRRWHVLLFMALMATTMLQGCGCVDTRLKTNKNKPMQGLPCTTIAVMKSMLRKTTHCVQGLLRKPL